MGNNNIEDKEIENVVIPDFSEGYNQLENTRNEEAVEEKQEDIHERESSECIQEINERKLDVIEDPVKQRVINLYKNRPDPVKINRMISSFAEDENVTIVRVLNEKDNLDYEKDRELEYVLLNSDVSKV